MVIDKLVVKQIFGGIRLQHRRYIVNYLTILLLLLPLPSLPFICSFVFSYSYNTITKIYNNHDRIRSVNTYGTTTQLIRWHSPNKYYRYNDVQQSYSYSTSAIQPLQSKPIRTIIPSMLYASTTLDNDPKNHSNRSNDFITTVSRSDFVSAVTKKIGILSTILLLPMKIMTTTTTTAYAFEGGVGGLGKTKPSTGVVLWDEINSPIVQNSNTGQIVAEINIDQQPILVSFISKWPLLSSTTFESRNIATSESAYIQVVEHYVPSNPKRGITTQTDFIDLLQSSVLAQQGKFGAYATPFDIKIKPSSFQIDNTSTTGMTNIIADVSFTTYTPGMHESERQVLIRAMNIFQDHWILLVTGTTKQRFNDRPIEQWQNIINSLNVVIAPSSSLSSK